MRESTLVEGWRTQLTRVEQVHIFGPAARWLATRLGDPPEQVDTLCDTPFEEYESLTEHLQTLGFGPDVYIADIYVDRFERRSGALRIPFDRAGVGPYSVQYSGGWAQVAPTFKVAETVNLTNLTARLECGENVDDVVTTIIECGGIDIYTTKQCLRSSGPAEKDSRWKARYSNHLHGKHSRFELYEGTLWNDLEEVADSPAFRQLVAGLHSRGQQTLAMQLAILAQLVNNYKLYDHNTNISLNIDGTWTTVLNDSRTLILDGAGGEQVGVWESDVDCVETHSGHGSLQLAQQLTSTFDLENENLMVEVNERALADYEFYEGAETETSFSLFEELEDTFKRRAILFDDNNWNGGPNSLSRAVAQNPRSALYADWGWLADRLGKDTVEWLIQHFPDTAIAVNAREVFTNWSETIDQTMLRVPQCCTPYKSAHLAKLSGLAHASATWAANSPDSFSKVCSTPLTELGAQPPIDAGLVLCPETYAASCPEEFGQSLLKQPAEQGVGEYGYDEASQKYPGAEYALEHFPQLAAQIAGEQFGEFLRHRLAQSSMLTRAFGRGGEKRLLEICQNPNRADVSTLAVYAQTLVKLERCVDEYANLLTDPLSDPVGVALCAPGTPDWSITEQLLAQVVQHRAMGGSLSTPADAKNVGGLDVATLAQQVDALTMHMADARERAQTRVFGSGEAALRYHAIVTGAESEGETMHAQYLQILTTTAAVRQTLLDAQVSHTPNMELVAVGKTMSALANRAENVYIQIRGDDGGVAPEAILPAVREQWAKLVKTFSAETSAFVTASSAGQRHTNMRKIGVGLGVATTVAELDCGRAAAVGR